MEDLSLKPRPEYKCLHCGKGEFSHKAKDRSCIKNPFKTFESSGKLTIKSKRAITEYENKQKSKVRNLTFEEVVTKVCELITEKTGLGIIVEQERSSSRKIYVTNLGGKIRLGHTTVSLSWLGDCHIAGERSGCFTVGHENSIMNELGKDFEELEELANQEKRE